MIAALICVVSAAIFLQFFVSYCRSILASSKNIVLSDRVREVTGIADQEVGADDFNRLLQLVRLCPERGDDQSEIRAVGTYYGLLAVLNRVSRPVAPRFSIGSSTSVRVVLISLPWRSTGAFPTAEIFSHSRLPIVCDFPASPQVDFSCHARTTLDPNQSRCYHGHILIPRAHEKRPMRIPLEQSVLANIRTSRMLAAGNRVGVAVSGGADSVALLRLLDRLRDELGITLTVVHFDHALRGAESDADAAFVAELANTFNLEFVAAREAVGAEAARQGWNQEDAARRLRYAFFERVISQGKATHIAVAHTADDQAETLLAHLMRGTGPTGLAGIYPVAGAVVRPLLGTRREILRVYLRANGPDMEGRFHESRHPADARTHSRAAIAGARARFFRLRLSDTWASWPDWLGKKEISGMRSSRIDSKLWRVGTAMRFASRYMTC